MQAVASGSNRRRLGERPVLSCQGSQGLQTNAMEIDVYHYAPRGDYTADVSLVRAEHPNNFHCGRGSRCEAWVFALQGRFTGAFAWGDDTAVFALVAIPVTDCCKGVSGVAKGDGPLAR